MIFDRIENFPLYFESFSFLKQIDSSLEKHPLSNHPLGITEIKGKDLFVNVMEYDTRKIDPKKAKLESHRDYVDVHMIDGEELIRFISHPKSEPSISYDKKHDVEFFEEKKFSSLILPTNYFALFLPNEAHEPGCMVIKPQKVRKYVFKLKATG